MSTEPGRSFGRATATHVLRTACSMVDMDPAGAELLRLGENAIFRLRCGPVVVRIARGMDHWASAQKEVQVSGWLEAVGLDAARVWPVTQPIEVDGHPITFWGYIAGRRGGPGDIRALGRILRRFHSLPPPDGVPVPDDDILDRVEPRIARSPIPSGDRALLSSVLADLRHDVATLTFPFEQTIVHGDAHVQNLMFVNDNPVLIDFERVARGQPEWDLAMTATEHATARWWSDEQYADFCDEYGFDVQSWGGFSTLQRVHEIKMTTWLMQNINESDAIRTEYARRMATIRDRRTDAQWSPF